MEPKPTSRRSKIFWLALLCLVPLAALGIPCVLGVLLRLRADAEPKLIADREQWPQELKDLVAQSHLTPDEIDSIEVVRLGMGDGWFCRMRKTANTSAFVTSRWIPIAKSPVAAAAQERFFDRLPNRWSKPTPTGRFFIHPQYSTQEEGNGTAFVGLIDDEQKHVFVWFYFNF